MVMTTTTERKGVATIELERQVNETPLEHHRRLIYGKLVDKNLSDYDFAELAPYLYGKEYSTDVARRMMYGSRMTLDLMDEASNTGCDAGVMSQIDARMVALQKERQKFFDQRREFNKLVQHEARYENLEQALIAAAERMSSTCEMPAPEDCFTVNPDNEAVLVFSDWHYGMTTKNIFNEYDTKICERRVMQVVSAAVERIRLHQVNRLHVVVLGDLLHGAIHVSARVASEELVADQLIHAAELLARAIECLSQHVREVVVYTTYGNHGRTVQSKGDSIHRDNMERIIGWWLEARMSGHQNVVICGEQQHEFLFVDACGHGICASHGDLDGVRSSPRLFQTLFSKRYGMDVECVLLGDKHHRESFDECGITSMLCGALCGTDDYANEKRLYSQPSQLMLIVNRENGIDAEYRLRCQ